MELFQLRGFLRVAEEGNITRAADALCLTQPAVTQQIRALERDLGTALFDRTGRGVVLTAAGDALRDYASRSLAILDESRQAIADLEAGEAGQLVLGAGVTTSILQLPEWLREFLKSYPRVDVVVRTGTSNRVAELATRREIDLGLVTSPVSDPDLRVVALYEEEIVTVAPPGHALTHGNAGLDELADASLILFPRGTGFREYMDQVLAEAGIAAEPKMETDSVEATKSLVAVGLGVAFLPGAAVESEVRSGQLARVEIAGLPALKRQTSLVYRKDRYLSAAARGFLGVLSARYPGTVSG